MELLILDHRERYEQEEILQFLLASAHAQTFPEKTFIVDLDNQSKRAELNNGLVEVCSLHSLPGFTKTREISCFETAHQLTRQSLSEEYPTADFGQGTTLYLEQRLSRYFLRKIYLNKVIPIAAQVGASTIILLRRGRNHWEHLLSDELHKLHCDGFLSRLCYCYLEMDFWIQVEANRNKLISEQAVSIEPVNSLDDIWKQEKFSAQSVNAQYSNRSKRKFRSDTTGFMPKVQKDIQLMDWVSFRFLQEAGSHHDCWLGYGPPIPGQPFYSP